MTLLVTELVAGITLGAIYATLALALVLVFRSTGVINFAQGEMALLSTYVAWQIHSGGAPLWAAVLVGAASGAVCGGVIEFLLVRRLARQDEASAVILTFGLFLVFSSTPGLIWGYFPKSLPSLFGSSSFHLYGASIGISEIGTVAFLVAEGTAMFLLVQKTMVGLSMRASVSNRESAQLVGVRVRFVSLIGWSLAGVVGALSGVLVAPFIYVEPGSMFSVLIYGLAGAALGGLDSFLGAIIGGLVVGITDTLASAYLPGLSSQYSLVVALAIIFVVLLARPQGIFGRPESARL